MSVTVLLAEKTSSAKKPPICRSIVTVFVTSAHHHVYIGINLTNCSGDIGGYYSSCHTIEARTTSHYE